MKLSKLPEYEREYNKFIEIDVEYFDSFKGLDEEVLEIINKKIKSIKQIYEERVKNHLNY